MIASKFKVQLIHLLQPTPYIRKKEKGRKQLSHFRMPIFLNFHVMLKSYILLYHNATKKETFTPKRLVVAFFFSSAAISHI